MPWPASQPVLFSCGDCSRSLFWPAKAIAPFESLEHLCTVSTYTYSFKEWLYFRSQIQLHRSRATSSASPKSNSFNMFHVFAFTYYILLSCVTREYSMMSVTTKNYSIYATRKYTTTNDEKYSIYATREYTTIFDLHDSLLERYMKHVFVADLVTGDFLEQPSYNFTVKLNDSYNGFFWSSRDSISFELSRTTICYFHCQFVQSSDSSAETGDNFV